MVAITEDSQLKEGRTVREKVSQIVLAIFQIKMSFEESLEKSFAPRSRVADRIRTGARADSQPGQTQPLFLLPTPEQALMGFLTSQLPLRER